MQLPAHRSFVKPGIGEHHEQFRRLIWSGERGDRSRGCYGGAFVGMLAQLFFDLFAAPLGLPIRCRLNSETPSGAGEQERRILALERVIQALEALAEYHGRNRLLLASDNLCPKSLRIQ